MVTSCGSVDSSFQGERKAREWPLEAQGLGQRPLTPERYCMPHHSLGLELCQHSLQKAQTPMLKDSPPFICFPANNSCLPLTLVVLMDRQVFHSCIKSIFCNSGVTNICLLGDWHIISKHQKAPIPFLSGAESSSGLLVYITVHS